MAGEGGKTDEAGVRLNNALCLTALVLSCLFLERKKKRRNAPLHWPTTKFPDR
jgi:hypothetical protein